MSTQVPRYALLAAKLQAAVVEKLKSALDVAVYDYVPEKTALPYVSIGAVSVVPYRLKIIAAVDVTLEVDYWSEYAGFAEAEGVLDTIIQTLTGDTLVVQDASVVDVVWDTCNLFVEATDTEIRRHGQLIIKWRLSA